MAKHSKMSHIVHLASMMRSGRKRQNDNIIFKDIGTGLYSNQYLKALE